MAEMFGRWFAVGSSAAVNDRDGLGVAVVILVNGELHRQLANGELPREMAHDVAHVAIQNAKRATGAFYISLAHGAGQNGQGTGPVDHATGDYGADAECDGPPSIPGDILRLLGNGPDPKEEGYGDSYESPNGPELLP